MQVESLTQNIVDEVRQVKGIKAIDLGGSRARGTQSPSSDIDLGIYYHPDSPLDLNELSRVATNLDDEHRADVITPIGGWGPWINGGGWLRIQSYPVDFLYRDLEKVRRMIEDCLNGKVEIFYQPGHPLGFVSSIYLAELPVESIEPLDQGMSLSRQYFALDDSKKPITEIQRGELVRVRLTVVLPAAVHYIVIDDPLPAGLEAIDATILTDPSVPLSYTLTDYEGRGWGWWYFTHAELRDEKVVLSADYLPAGTYVYTYLARASTAGMFRVIPPSASEFYFPDVGGRGAGSVFEVKP